MNLEKKFRAWDPDTKKMSRAFFIYELSNNVGGDLGVSTGSIFEVFLEFDCDGQIIKKVDFLQFTGVHDKYGKEIYEGDVLKTSSGNKPVEYEAATGFFGNMFDGENPSYCEIIGNIYENPELLE